jgi:hypothetical protein
MTAAKQSAISNIDTADCFGNINKIFLKIFQKNINTDFDLVEFSGNRDCC